MNKGIITFEYIDKLLTDNMDIINGIVEKNTKMLNLIILRYNQNDKCIQEVSRSEKQ